MTRTEAPFAGVGISAGNKAFRGWAKFSLFNELEVNRTNPYPKLRIIVSNDYCLI